MNLEEQYADLENIIDTLTILLKETTEKEYKNEFEILRDKAIADKEEIEKQLNKEYDKESKEMQRQFDNERI